MEAQRGGDVTFAREQTEQVLAMVDGAMSAHGEFRA
jgi:hypothetical protein